MRRDTAPGLLMELLIKFTLDPHGVKVSSFRVLPAGLPDAPVGGGEAELECRRLSKEPGSAAPAEVVEKCTCALDRGIVKDLR